MCSVLCVVKNSDLLKAKAAHKAHNQKSHLVKANLENTSLYIYYLQTTNNIISTRELNYSIIEDQTEPCLLAFQHLARKAFVDCATQ